MRILWLDFETRSRCDLKKHGAYIYAQDASTDILCLCYAFDDDEVLTWVPGQAFPEDISLHFENGGQIRAHNAQFDRLITWYILCPDEGIPEPPLERWYCTAAQARSNGLPGALGSAGQFVGAQQRKDYRGATLIRALSMPQADGTFNEDPQLMAEMIVYCRADVIAMRYLSEAMRGMSDEELLDYHVNERINDLGVLVDVPLCLSAIQYAGEEKKEIDALVKDITEGVITNVRSTKTRDWVLERVGDQAVKMMETYKSGDKKHTMDKSVRANLLDLAEEDSEQVPPDVADVIQCVDDLSASSVAKFKKLADLADPEDHRVRGAFVFAGGSATGRYASFGAQVHNFVRSCHKDPQAVREALVHGEAIAPVYGPCVTAVLKKMLRPALIPPIGNLFVVADWSSIEARVNPWLSQHPAGDDVLNVFRTGADLYVREAAKIFGCREEAVDKDRRMIGKIAVLALGYGGSVGAFQSLSRAYGVVMSEAQIMRTVNVWRQANPWAVSFWRKLENGYMLAMRQPGRESAVNSVTYMFDGTHLWCSLPSGRVLCYPFAEVSDGSLTYAKASLKPAAGAKKWPRAYLYGGKICENVVQATANDILRYALRELDDLFFGITLHVHDEIVVECKDYDATTVLKAMEKIMTTAPTWAKGLPLAVDIKIMERYGKG